MMKLLSIPTVCILLTACQPTIDERFQQVCDEIRSEAVQSKQLVEACKFGVHAPDKMKVSFIEAYAKRQKACGALEAAGEKCPPID